MQTGRLNAEKNVRQLTEENEKKATRIKTMIADFEAMKNELLENNAIKDNYIDSLNNVLYGLNQQLVSKQESLQETSFTHDFEKQRLTKTLEDRDVTIERLKTKVEILENDITDNSSLIDQKNYDIKLLQDKLSALESEYKSEQDRLNGEISSILKDLRKKEAQIKESVVKLKEKDETITRLENNVKLLKKEIGQN